MKRLFLILTLAISSSFLAEGRPYYFRHYTNDNGLSNNTVMDGIQDRRGFMWFATKEGLNRFDGSQFRIFSHNQAKSNSLLNNYVLTCDN